MKELKIPFAEKVDIDIEKIPVELVREILAINLYNKGIITQNQGARILGVTRREFEQILVKNSIPVTGESDEEMIAAFQKSINK